MTALRLGTRGSALALTQSQMVADALTAATGRPVELVRIVTPGDRSSAPIARIGVGVFVSALRDALVASVGRQSKSAHDVTPAGVVERYSTASRVR